MLLLNTALALVMALAGDPAMAGEPAWVSQPENVGRTQPNKGSDPTLTPEYAAQQDSVKKYIFKVIRSLGESADPRGRVLALAMEYFWEAGENRTPAEIARRGVLVRAAAEAAPGDPLIQWFWASGSWWRFYNSDHFEPINDSLSGCDATNPCPNRLAALARLQPDNAAAWLPVFNSAWRAKRSLEVETTLARMAQATKYDELQMDEWNALLAALRRYPLPAAAIETIDTPDADSQLSDIALIGAASVAAVDIEPLSDACNRKKHPDAPKVRFGQCAEIGRVMLNRSASIGGRMWGGDLLSAAGEATAEDISTARTIKWLRVQLQNLPSNRIEHPIWRENYHADWLATGDEVQALSHELQRAGISLTPPSGWEYREPPPVF